MKITLSNLIPTEKALLASSFFQNFGIEAAYFVGITGYAAYELEAGPELIALVMFYLTMFQMIGSAVSGALIDRMGPRKTLIMSMSLNIAISLFSLFLGHNVPVFIAFVAGLGLTFSMSRTSFHSFAPYIYDQKAGLSRVNSLILGAAYTASIIGPAAGALVVRNFPIQTVFLVAAGVSLVALYAAFRSEELRCPVNENREKHALKDSLEGLRLNLTISTLRFYLLIGILMWFSFGAFDALESLYYKDVVGVGVEWMGWVNSFIGLGLVIGVFFLSRFSPKMISSIMLTMMLALVGAGSILYTATTSIYFVMAGGFILGIGFGIGEPMMRTLIQHDAPLESVGRVMGASTIVRAGMTLMPLAVAPQLSKLFGVQKVLVGASALTVLFAVMLIPYSLRVDKREKSTRNIGEIHPLEDSEDIVPRDRTPLGLE